MNDLVFLEPNKLDSEPFTTSKVIAEGAWVQHHTVTKLIQKHEADFKEFGLVRFKIDAAQHSSGTKYEKEYCLNEQQSTLLITYLKNTEPVRQFKRRLSVSFIECARNSPAVRSSAR